MGGDLDLWAFCLLIAAQFVAVIFVCEERAEQAAPGAPGARQRRRRSFYWSPIFSAAMKADCGISTLPNWRMRFLPSFCFSRSLRLRVTSPP